MKILSLLLSFFSLLNMATAQIPSGTVLWLRADQQVTTTAGNKVTAWKDVSGNNNHVSQATIVNQPVFVQNVFSNQPSILFDGVNGKFFLNNTTTNLVTAGGPRTIFVVGKMDCAAVANGGGAFPGGGGALFTFRRGTPNFCIEDVTVSPYGNFVYTAGLGTFSNETVNDNFINTSKFTFVNTYISNGAGTHLQLRQNGLPVIVTPQSPCGSLSSCDPAIPDNSTTGFTVGDREDIVGQDWQGYISEIIVYPNALSVSDIQQVEQYLSTKYFLSTGAPFTNITASPKNNSTNINIEGDWKHSYNIGSLSNIILSIKDTCNINEIRIDTVYNEVGNSLNVGTYKFMRRHYTVKYSNGSTGIKKVRLYFSNADFSALQTSVPGLYSASQLFVVRYSGPTENGSFDTTDASQVQHFQPGQLITGSAYNNKYIELSTYKLGEFWIYAKPVIPIAIPCNNWLNIPNYSTTDYVSIGDLDITGNKITVEASFNADTNYFLSSTISYDLVSKHTDPSNANYLLRPVHVGITTTNGFFDILTCDYKPKKINHAALVYDGSTLKFYRNGFLMGTKPASGNLVTNDLVTKIGNYSFGNQAGALKGYMNEVRIWNIPRTQNEIRTYMNASLPNPSTQTGLVAYYTFDNLNNKQGNAAWNGTLHGAASINNNVPNCIFIADSCDAVTLQQSCNGSLGAPVVNIDFGSGALNPGPQLSVAVPGASTNYNFASYATGNPPAAPLDGDYALVNSVPVNGAWHTGAKDHTGNANGYMAFFNAAPAPGEFYRQTVTDLCPGTTYEFAAWVANVINASILPTAVLPNITFNILDPNTQAVLATYNTGDIPHLNSLTWKQYSFLFLLPAGNNAVTLVLANNNIGGNAQPGNDLAIDDITFRPCGPLTNASFSNAVQVDSTAITGCSNVNLFGIITGSFNSPSYQWQISNDAGITYTDIAGANALNPIVSNLADGQYQFRLLSAEAGNISSPNCRFISRVIKLSVSGCARPAGIHSIINDYTPVTALDPCTNKLSVENAAQYNIGDTVLLIQMKGAAIDSSNTNTFGTLTNLNNAGVYEFNSIKNKTGNTIELKNTLVNQYDAAFGKVQLVRVPYFQTATISDTLTCLPWDGNKGGVLVLNSATDVILNAPIDVSNKGFRGGQIGTGYRCASPDWAVASGIGGTKGEGIADYIAGSEAGGARLANGGGGSFSANSGAGGGANFGSGGIGGREYNGCSAAQQSIGGEALDYTAGNKVFLGGGGGGAEQDNGQPIVPGGNGGGIVIIKAVSLNSNNQTISSNGQNITAVISDEGGAGGGAGGSILLYVNNYLGNLSVLANGGRGSDNNNQIYPGRCHGPGAGGGGGYIGFSNASLPASVGISFAGGVAGILLNPASACFNTTGGAAEGAGGGNKFNLVFPQSIAPFKKNIDSLQIKKTITGCKSFDFNGLAFTNTSPIQSWLWSFDDGSTAATQNVTHTFATAGLHTVKLIATDLSGCKDSLSSTVTSSGINFDFTFEQDVCNPRSVKFTAIGDTTAAIFWSLGNGTVVNNIRNPLQVYADTGSYLVQYSTGNTACVDTMKKKILISYRNANIILTPDTTICFNTSKLLRSNIDSSLKFCWSPDSFLNNVNIANPTTSTPSTIRYSLVAATAGNNLVTNGDFNNGNAGFTSGYLPAPSLPLTTGSYTVTTTALNAGPATADCKDHSSTAGNMMVLWGNENAREVWKQTVTVSPNTNYIFKLWAQTVTLNNLLTLRMSINGNIALDTATSSVLPCNWKQFTTVWNSGTNTSATLAVLNRPHTDFNDYFALDDISFSSYSINRDTVIITVDTPFINTRPDTTVCQSSPVPLNTTGAATYSWLPAEGLSDATISNPVATPDTTQKYIVTGTNTFGCIAKDSLTITVNPKPKITITGNGDTLVCRNTSVPLFATGGVTYLWSPANTLDNPNIPNPVARPTAGTFYFVKVTGVNNCSNRDSVMVRIKPIPTFTVSPGQSGCQGTSPQLNASGGNYYLWSPASLVSNPIISNPLAIAGNTTIYSVIIKETNCNDSTLLTTTLTVLPLPAIAASRSNDINCAVGSSNLTATGGLQYTWSPATGLNDRTIASPVASITSTTVYTVKGTDNNGCSNTDAVTVTVDLTGKANYLMPNAFSPNGDGVNDCYRIKYFGLIQELQFFIFNRLGNMVFNSTNPDACWDGTYKGNPAAAGNYVYYIKAKTACGPVERKGNLILVR